MSIIEKSKISTKNTKTEILEAYNKLIKEQESLLDKDRLQEKEMKDKVMKVEKVGKNDKKSIIHSIADLKIEINNSLDILTKNLLERKTQLEEMQDAIKITSANLKDLYDIEVNARTLEALLISQKKQKELFEQEMDARKSDLKNEINIQKTEWQKEQEDYKTQQQEKIRLLKLERAREEEEHQYKIRIRDQKDKDEYEQKKTKLNRELEENRKQAEENINQRIANIKLQEEELKSLRKLKENYDKEISSAIESTKNEVTKQIETKYKHELQLKTKDTDATMALLKQTIESLKEKITEKDKIINSMQSQVNTAQVQSQELAKKVVEGVNIKNQIKNQKLEVTE